MNKTTRAASIKNIEVAVRMRPLLNSFEDEPAWSIDKRVKTVSSMGRLNPLKSISLNDSSLFIKKKADVVCSYNFCFDYVFDHDSHTSELYSQACSKLIDAFVGDRNNCTIFMYGQTTSGKTYTMLGDEESPGIISFSLQEIFKRYSSALAKDPDSELSISYLEIYNQQINDLLNPGSVNLKIQEESSGVVQVINLTQYSVSTYAEAQVLLSKGEQQRIYKEKSFHDHSSRSHTIFQVRIKSSKSGKTHTCCLNLVDLAGSERLQDDEKGCSQINQEAAYINKSLFVLSNVISKLAKSKKKNLGHIPFRDSKLTRLLSNSLNGNSNTLIICTLSPAAMNFYQTLSTLRFATNAKKVQTRPSPVDSEQSMDKENTLDMSKQLAIANEKQLLLKKELNLVKKNLAEAQKSQSRLFQQLEMFRRSNSKAITRKSSVQSKASSYKLTQNSHHNISTASHTSCSTLNDSSKDESTRPYGQSEDPLQQTIAAVQLKLDYGSVPSGARKTWNDKSKALYQQYLRNLEVIQSKYQDALNNIAKAEFPGIFQKQNSGLELNKFDSKFNLGPSTQMMPKKTSSGASQDILPKHSTLVSANQLQHQIRRKPNDLNSSISTLQTQQVARLESRLKNNQLFNDISINSVLFGNTPASHQELESAYTEAKQSLIERYLPAKKLALACNRELFPVLEKQYSHKADLIRKAYQHSLEANGYA